MQLDHVLVVSNHLDTNFKRTARSRVRTGFNFSKTRQITRIVI